MYKNLFKKNNITIFLLITILFICIYYFINIKENFEISPTIPIITTTTSLQPTSTQPTSTQPTSIQPTSTQPTSTQPTSTQPISTQPTPTMPNITTSIPTITQIPITNNYDDYNIGMMLKGMNNKHNLNDFIAKNTLLGNNLYISPMNKTGIVENDNKDNIFKKTKTNKNIDSTFTPMIKLI